MDTRLNGSVVFVTGAASGQGKATVGLFAEEGAVVIVADRHGAAAEETAEELRAGGHDAMAVEVDVADAEAVNAAFDAVVGRYGRVDVLVNNAAVGFSENARLTMANVVDTPLEHWNAILAINLTGPALCAAAVLPRMAEQGSGVIINIASINGLVGLTGADAYTATKGGLIALTRSIAAEWSPRGIRVNCICPGGVDTPMIRAIVENPEAKKAMSATTPLGRLATPEEIAAVSVFLASPLAGYVNGAVLPVDGGYTAV
ncbi:SDR family oxidoreductase [Herbiconiux sp. CPCC 203407]|uniref:SDR family oxidoreductase n=1 Tax=Herbiconiux oxytropis TaxID=2970915 RepID=A0AA41XJZ5_9MICO|nr:SDR family oxidoreductase [Herbiconiux oxytropis]MCS5724139.1 SDR family oxidoreductase [Herbiconiux oxytropis]MCS5726926.1 SDR family oxidoreductase [Herbiconiux oxytropis]